MKLNRELLSLLQILNYFNDNYNKSNIHKISVNKLIHDAKELDLSDLIISSIDRNLFSSLSNLISLDLSYCKLDALNYHAFKGCCNLEKLNLNNNCLLYLTKDNFSGLERLRILDLSYNSIVDLKNNQFMDLISLQELNLSNNSISSLQEQVSHEVFFGLNNLRKLRLCNNKIEEINDFSFKFLSNLKLVNVKGNPIKIATQSAINHLDTFVIDFDLISDQLKNQLRAYEQMRDEEYDGRKEKYIRPKCFPCISSNEDDDWRFDLDFGIDTSYSSD